MNEPAPEGPAPDEGPSLDQSDVGQVIRPAAILTEAAARQILAALEAEHVARGGVWRATPGLWERWSEPWLSGSEPGDSVLLGQLSCIYDQPSKYCITVFRASISDRGAAAGWTVESLCDDAFAKAELTLQSCPRAELSPPPSAFRMP